MTTDPTLPPTLRSTLGPTLSAQPTFGPSPPPTLWPPWGSTPAPTVAGLMTEAEIVASLATGSGRTIVLGADIVLTATLTIGSGVTGVVIIGQGHMLSGGDLVRCFNVSGPGTELSLHDIVISNGFASTHGGGIFVSNVIESSPRIMCFV